jgi:hypothetical protein
MLPIPRPAKVMLAALALLVVIILAVFLFSLPDYPVLYGIKEVAEVNGHPIFLKRESSSMFYDRTSLSLDGDRCTDPNPEFDYRLTPLGAGDSPPTFKSSAINSLCTNPWTNRPQSLGLSSSSKNRLT